MVDVVERNGAYFAFTVNNESVVKGDAKVRITSVKLGWSDNSELEQQKFVFKYVSEVMGTVANFNGDKLKPTFLRVLENGGEFYLNIGLGSQVLVFKRPLNELQAPSGCNTPPASQLKKTKESAF